MHKRGVKTWSLRILAGLLGLLVIALLGVWLFLRASLAQLDGVRHAQQLIERLLGEREALTKAAFAERLTNTVPSGRRRASAKSLLPHSSRDSSHSAGHRP